MKQENTTNGSIATRKEEWDGSYSQRDNFLFYPNEEVIRFFSKYIRKRIGLHEFKDICSFATTPRVLDLGCGIGRHVIFASKMGLEAHGIDLSDDAIQVARHWAEEEGIEKPHERIFQGDVRHLPWPDGYFDYVTSYGVLDSMYFDIAKAAIPEVSRVMTSGGLFFCDLISGDDSDHYREFAGEEVLTRRHERGTVQSFFNFEKINRLADGFFEIVEATLTRRENVSESGYLGRYHVVFKKL